MKSNLFSIVGLLVLLAIWCLSIIWMEKNYDCGYRDGKIAQQKIELKNHKQRIYERKIDSVMLYNKRHPQRTQDINEY